MKSTNRKNLANLLAAGVQQLTLELSLEQQGKLLDYLALMQKWNGVYNLTAIRDPEQMVMQHLLDSLAVVKAFNGMHSILDVGSGGGLPGIVLAIARPDMQVSLIDTVQKKTAFLSQVKAELGLGNVTVHSGRVERLQSNEKFDAITSRAFANLADFVTLSEQLLKDGGCFIAMKGAVPQVEIAQLPPGWGVTEIRPIKVPGLNAERHLIFMNRSAT